MSRSLRRVLMIGTSPETMGGIASVVSAYRAGGLFERLPVTYIATHLDGSWIRKLAVAVHAWFRFAGWLAFRRGFLLHVHASSRASFWRKTLFILPALWTGRPVVFHLHGSEFIRFYFEESGALARSVIRGVMDRCTMILVLSESWRREVARITSNENVVVLLNPALATDGPASSQDRRDHVLLFLGRLGQRKGIYVLLESMATVRRRFADTILLCGGDGELERVRSEASRLGLQDHVKLLGWVRGAAKSELLVTSTIYVLPSFDEGVPMSILEAMAAGLPIVSTPVGGIPEVVTDGHEGLLVAPGNADALAEAICKLLGDPELRSRMGANARARFQRKFCIESVLGRLESHYRELGLSPLTGKVATHSK